MIGRINYDSLFLHHNLIPFAFNCKTYSLERKDDDLDDDVRIESIGSYKWIIVDEPNMILLQQWIEDLQICKSHFDAVLCFIY